MWIWKRTLPVKPDNIKIIGRNMPMDASFGKPLRSLSFQRSSFFLDSFHSGKKVAANQMISLKYSCYWQEWFWAQHHFHRWILAPWDSFPGNIPECLQKKTNIIWDGRKSLVMLEEIGLLGKEGFRAKPTYHDSHFVKSPATADCPRIPAPLKSSSPHQELIFRLVRKISYFLWGWSVLQIQDRG